MRFSKNKSGIIGKAEEESPNLTAKKKVQKGKRGRLPIKQKKVEECKHPLIYHQETNLHLLKNGDPRRKPC